ncbi:calcium/sodium antiporter [Oceaniglobus roseus]|uniref:calcium/sodium antiporter n=1 Tax=Oceaniglobus roseus TaxID=1737570 RepID=UPI000C7EC4C5|nr:calcium/sodium antiporter [Kandeliimicrobium roseum]
MDILLILLGFAGLVAGGELLVRGAVSVALRSGLSPLVIGLTLVGFGTSMPELFTSVQAALDGSPGIAVGNVVGSNICNILLILGVAGLMAPVLINAREFRRDGAVLAAATALALGVTLWGGIGRGVGAAFVLLLALYVWRALRDSRNLPEATADIPEAPAHTMPVSLLLFAAGLGLILLGARLLVGGAIGIADSLGVSEAIIGLTVVAVGTSLPELVTTVMAALKGRSDIAFGNIVGSNIFNVLGILGVTALVKPLEVPRQIALFDIWAMCGATLLLILFARFGARLGRGRGALLLGGYVGYLAVLTRLA